jgi:hypothetical protein
MRAPSPSLLTETMKISKIETKTLNSQIYQFADLELGVGDQVVRRYDEASIEVGRRETIRARRSVNNGVPAREWVFVQGNLAYFTRAEEGVKK